MSASETFNPVDAAAWGRIQHKVNDQAGISIDGNSGDAEKHGVKLGWAYDPDAGTLTVTLESRAWYDPDEATIMSKLKAWIDSAIAGS